MGSKYPDNFFDADIAIIRDIAADRFHTDDDTEIKPSSDGSMVKRFAELGRTDPTGARSISRDKEYGFRPKMAGLNPEQINYRRFEDSPNASSSGSAGGDPLGDDPGESAGSINVGIGTNPNENGGGGDWDLDYDVHGFEVSLVSDIGGAAKTAPSWNPSHMNGENRSTLVISRRGKKDEDKGDDLPHRYFSRIHDLLVPIPTNKVSLQRVRYNGGQSSGGGGGTPQDTPLGDDPGESAGGINVGIGTSEEEGEYGKTFFNKSESTEQYDDGIWKSALNISAKDSPGLSIDQKNEHNGGPGEHGWATHDYVPGFPQSRNGGDADAEPPENYPQGGWIYDGVQDTIANFQDLIGVDGWVGSDYGLPRYRNRFDQKVSIAFIRHDAHFMKKGDAASPPPKSNGTRLSGRIYFTKEMNCPSGSIGVATGGGGGDTSLGPVTGSPPNQPQPGPPSDPAESGTPVCGEMILDVKLADKDTNVKHESGEWRPYFMSAGGGGGDKYDHSYHSKPKKYSGSGTSAGGAPTPTGVPTTGQMVGSMTMGDSSIAGMGSTSMFAGVSVATASLGTMTTQSQMGSPPPESPGQSQNVNVFENVQTPNVLNTVGVFTITKPVGYRTLKLTAWMRASDAIPVGQTIEMNFLAGEYSRDDKGPQEFYRVAVKMTSETFPYDKRWRKIVMFWPNFNPDSAHPITIWVERRNDLSNINVQVWTLKYHFDFEP